LDPASFTGFDRVLARFVEVWRRAGVPSSPVEMMDAQRAAIHVGLGSREGLRFALMAVLVKSERDRLLFESVFEAFFADSPLRAGSLEKLREEGFDRAELEALRRAIEAAQLAERPTSSAALDVLVAGGGALEQAMLAAGRSAAIEGIRNPMQVGYYTQRLLSQLDLDGLGRSLVDLRASLAPELGERADTLIDALSRQVAALRPVARRIVERELARQQPLWRESLRRRMLSEQPFVQLSGDQLSAVRREVERMAERLGGSLAVRRKRMRRGKLDIRRTLRRAMQTEGMPFRLVRRRRRRDRPRLVVLCDISESVRFTARFLLILIHAIQDAFSKTRSFAFVADLGDIGDVLASQPIERAIDLVYSGACVRVMENSDYGRALAQFDERYIDLIDRRTTVLIIGDGRNNYQDPRADVLRKIRSRADRVLWFNPEPRASWGFGDSAMQAWLPYCEAHPTYNLTTLRQAVDRIVAPSRKL